MGAIEVARLLPAGAMTAVLVAQELDTNPDVQRTYGPVILDCGRQLADGALMLSASGRRMIVADVLGDGFTVTLWEFDELGGVWELIAHRWPADVEAGRDVIAAAYAWLTGVAR